MSLPSELKSVTLNVCSQLSLLSLPDRYVLKAITPRPTDTKYTVSLLLLERSSLKAEDILVLPLDLLDRASHQEKTATALKHFGDVNVICISYPIFREFLLLFLMDFYFSNVADTKKYNFQNTDLN